MQTYKQVDEFMKRLDLKYFKNTKDFVADLMYKTDKEYTTEVATFLNSRALGQNSDNDSFYRLKNKILAGSLCVSAAFDSGVFRHIGNMLVDNSDLLCGTVLDIGCDCGIVTCFMASENPDTKFIGVDKNELAVNNAKELAETLRLKNVEFVTADVYDFALEEKANAVTSFRCLLDIAQTQTKGVSVIGERGEREARYAEAFSPLAKAVCDNLTHGGTVISVERYTALYGWLGWMSALSNNGVNPLSDKCALMTAQDISSTIEYSVTFAQKGSTSSPLEAYDCVMSEKFKSGAGVDGANAEYALYKDSDEIHFTDVKKGEKLIHQFATAVSPKGKYMFYEADLDRRSIKYVNEKKREKMMSDFEDKKKMYNPDEYTMNDYSIKSCT